ncbi:MAG TPA: hypothetical protein VGF59_20535 [Bryobacteraceae bacterium]|jgi:uncharacterized protein (TIGR03437 family)
MFRAWLLPALSAASFLWAADTASGAAPSYTQFSIVNAANFAPGDLAPNTVVSVFGSGMARSAQALTADDIRAGKLPLELNYVRVDVNGSPAPLFYVSDGQVNFLMPPEQLVAPVKFRIIREGVAGPEVILPLVDAAPALFQTPAGYAIAQHGLDFGLITPDSPAKPGEVIVLYATGLGRTERNPIAGEIPQWASPIVRLADLKVTLSGAALDPARVQYAGLTPGSAGLYQINLKLPDTLGPDPEIRISLGASTTPAPLKLPVDSSTISSSSGADLRSAAARPRAASPAAEYSSPWPPAFRSRPAAAFASPSPPQPFTSEPR